MRNILNNIRNWLTPKYSEVTSFLTALTCLFSFLTYPDFRNNYIEIITGTGGGPAAFSFILLGTIVTLGFFFSIYHVFTDRKKTLLEKDCMGVFTISVNGIAGIAAGIELLPSRPTILIVFPIFNILMGILLLYQMSIAKFNITDDNARPIEVIIGEFILIVLFVISFYLLHMTWAMTFSMCMFYSSSIVFFIDWLVKKFYITVFGR